jgi:hypothetical protein
MQRSRGIATVTALAGVCAALLAPAAGAAEPQLFEPGYVESAAATLALESTLRLTDLPAGFVLGPEVFCGEPRRPSENEGILEQEEHLPPNPSEAFINATKAPICTIEYERLYRAAGAGATPSLVQSFALATPNPQAAARGLALGAEPFEYTLEVGGLAAAGPAPPIGEEARLFHTDRARFRSLSGLPGSLLLWRQGAVIAGVFAASMKTAVSDAAAQAYAARQQTYVTAPRPYLDAEAEDRTTYLDNPNIKVPIYWLGPAFEPKGLPATDFERAVGGEELVLRISGRELSVQYSNDRDLDTWTPSGWAKFSQTTLGKRQWSWHCTRSETLKLPHGHAVIYASYRKDETTCPSSPPRHFSADVFLPGAVIAIGEPSGRYGQGEIYGYESWRGMKAIARALRPYRPRPGEEPESL